MTSPASYEYIYGWSQICYEFGENISNTAR